MNRWSFTSGIFILMVVISAFLVKEVIHLNTLNTEMRNALRETTWRILHSSLEESIEGIEQVVSASGSDAKSQVGTGLALAEGAIATISRIRLEDRLDKIQPVAGYQSNDISYVIQVLERGRTALRSERYKLTTRDAKDLGNYTKQWKKVIEDLRIVEAFCENALFNTEGEKSDLWETGHKAVRELDQFFSSLKEGS
ncbi:hypothetical protein [Moorella sulfitireducens (nom. illeg.)]|uniref:hypothetical protein n=1 Tax=Neomoorella sulfitireducens TaxID=2972948 RepID=UPI0021AC8E55|nr:hypothetical protein [Moorella sulfitireducens]